MGMVWQQGDPLVRGKVKEFYQKIINKCVTSKFGNFIILPKTYVMSFDFLKRNKTGPENIKLFRTQLSWARNLSCS